MDLKQFPMPNDLLQMKLKVLNGVDPDTIDGIERLWLWNAQMQSEQFEEDHRQFFEWLRKGRPTK
jgi:hypothetical protein